MALVLVIAAIAGGGTYVATGGTPIRVDSYRIADASTIVIEAEGGRGSWLRLTDVVESDTEVRITLKRVSIPFFGRSSVGIPEHFVVELAEPLADRIVHDGFDQVVIRQ